MSGNMSKDTILFISEAKSYLSTLLQEKLSEEGFHVRSSGISEDDLSQIKSIGESLQIILVYIDENILRASNSLVYLKNAALEKDLPIFIIGREEEIKVFKAAIPGHVIQREFVRPFDGNEVIESVGAYIQLFGHQKKRKILVVDDSGAMLRNVKGWLQGSYQVMLANSGAMAIKSMTLSKPDLVLLDYEMPVVNGKQIFEMIRSEQEFEDVPVIFLTGKSDKESVMEVMALKPDGYLLKTMAPNEIIAYVDAFFSKQKNGKV